MPARKKKAKEGEHDLQGKLEALKADLEALQRDIKGLAGEASSVASERVSVALKDAMERVQEMTDRVEEWGEDNLDSLREQVRDQPLASIVVSLGLGALIGAILLRR